MQKTRKREDYRKPLSVARATDQLTEAKCLCCRQPFLSTDRRSNRICAPCKDPVSGADFANSFDAEWSSSFAGMCGGGRQAVAQRGCL